MSEGEALNSLHYCVLWCSNLSKYNYQLSFHSFPVDPEAKSVWVAKIWREKFSPTNGTRVCFRVIVQFYKSIQNVDVDL